jgi:hypothetical protein
MDGEERRTGRVEVPPTRVPERGRRAPYAVLALGVATICGAVAIAQLGPATVPEPIAFDLPTRPPATLAATASPAATQGPVPDAVPPRLSRTDLGERVRDGSLDGRLVFVDGVLQATEVACEPPWDGGGGPCQELSVPGLGLEVRPEPVAMPWRGLPPPGAWIVTVARNGRLGYLGSLVPERVMAGDAEELVVRLIQGDVAPRGSLFQVDGWLIVTPNATCRRPDASRTTPCPLVPPFLAADPPSAFGIRSSNRGAAVDLAASVVDVDPDEVMTPGVFLLAPPEACDLGEASDACLDLDWTLVARYEPARSVRVLVP